MSKTIDNHVKKIQSRYLLSKKYSWKNINFWKENPTIIVKSSF